MGQVIFLTLSDPQPFAWIALGIPHPSAVCTMNTTAFDVESLSPGYPPDSPPVPRFLKSKESKVVKAVKREETLESVSQGSTAASRRCPAFFANHSDDENSEPDFGLSLRGPPGLCQQASWRPTSYTSCLLPSECVCGAKAPTVTVAPSLESRASHDRPVQIRDMKFSGVSKSSRK